MHRPFSYGRDFVRLGKDRRFGIAWSEACAQKVQQPVRGAPLGSVTIAPGGYHRIGRFAFHSSGLGRHFLLSLREQMSLTEPDLKILIFLVSPPGLGIVGYYTPCEITYCRNIWSFKDFHPTDLPPMTPKNCWDAIPLSTQGWI